MILAEFFLGLAGMYPASLPAKSALSYMRRRLDGESLTAEQVQRLYDRICDTLQYHPTWEGLNAVIGELGYRAKRQTGLIHWLAFDLHGYAYVMRCPDPSHPPAAPLGASNVHLIVDRPITDDEMHSTPVEPIPYERPLALSKFGEPRQGRFLPTGDIVLEVVEDIAPSVSARLSQVDAWDDL
jgi:hypothetical protein